ncbi:O-acetyl-ADP-ribose deacetylase (regulator of RNase III), contains Macro domain [Gracilimonas mengyeensis]|uniref:O-acetyl-ADP-ribose deacetylase (Regulator of RNase III), contains Macro domain n=2 Tax=Gracilimonas mengyeensis TaxID=1302730 RepID=A0A521CIX0_9BACT|nr:O-acetyl-ADP-ribose deacetylase (regulator of RNase III), contains Macro domain [Gracilimonas mengyeensis]
MPDYNNVDLNCTKGNIANQPDVEAIVNAANAQLKTGGGVAGAIHNAAGPGLAEECEPKAPIKPSEAVISGAHDLPNKYVIHCLGPVYGQDKPEDKLLRNCYQNSLKLAEEYDIKSIAFPAISTGVFGFPRLDAARIAMITLKDEMPDLESVKEIRFVLFSDEDLELHQDVMKEVFEN